MFKASVKVVLILLFFCVNRLQAENRKDIYWAYLNEDVTLKQAEETLVAYGKIRVVSRGLHAISLKLNIGVNAESLSSLSLVSRLEPVRLLYTPPEPEIPRRLMEKTGVTKDPVYGYAYDQLQSVGIIDAHNQGYTGQGIRIGILDTGFKTSLDFFEKIRMEERLIAEWDFINNDGTTEDEAGDGEDGTFQTHGTGVWSIIGGYEEGEFIGGAFDAEFVLAKTEVLLSETPIEEDYFAAAIEWFDSLEVDIASASLAYLEFKDDPELSYPVSALDGQTTVVARICNWAASRGMIIVNAAGNEGPGPTTLWSPGDSPLVITVGSVNETEEVSTFSGRGPTADGRIKPDIAALGEKVYKALPSGEIAYGHGTSYATPLIACGVALIKQLRPDWDVQDILKLFKHYARQEKNNDTGWGVPDFGKMVRDLYQSSLTSFSLTAYPNPATYGITILSPRIAPTQSLKIYDLRGREIWKTSNHSLDDSLRFFIPVSNWPAGIYFGQTGGQTVKFIKL
ncbi:TPA: hypothetical protein DCG86_05515 [Candidatus Marinimicrobia bacterium]|nr:hypothetical protein [Candidatus Neomarinimicrobiota bacterium]